MKIALIAFIFGILSVPAFGWIYFRYGYAPVATASSPMPFEKQLAHMALQARIEAEAPKNAPLPTTEQNYSAGATLYRKHCAVCHSLPDQTPTATAEGMFPKPPKLFKGKGVTDDPPGETYWKIRNGIRLTGMPAYNGALNDTEMWQISLLLANADKLPPTVTEALKQPLQTE